MQEFHVIATHYFHRFDTVGRIRRFARGRDCNLAETGCVNVHGDNRTGSRSAEQRAERQ